LTEVGLKNEAVHKYMEGQSAQYGAALSSANLYLLPEQARLEGVTSELAASSRYFISAMEAAARAAEQAQSTNIQLADAYNLVQKAAGEGAAAIEAGRLSSLRAGVSVSASGGIGASGQYTYSLSKEYANSVSEGQSASDSIKV
jgi:pyruvoyl-dependent arginine decarboxylase (PvlArgDC)